MESSGELTRLQQVPVTLSIAIVTYNSVQTIQSAIDSIIQCLPKDVPTKIVVVDNHSTDSTLERLQTYVQHHQNVTLIHNLVNRGFGLAHNQAISAVDSVYHVICNPDIRLSNDIFSPLINHLNRSPRIGLSCPRFLNEEGTLQPLNRRYPTVVDLFLRRFTPSRLRKLVQKRLLSYEMQDVGYTHSYDVPFLSGAFMFCRTEILKAVGGFDKRYFLYFEDADLSRKVQDYGYRTVFFPDVSVTHVWERLAHKSLHGSWLFVQSAYRYFWKWGFKLW
jgi:GT2 family glycosyltransferase